MTMFLQYLRRPLKTAMGVLRFLAIFGPRGLQFAIAVLFGSRKAVPVSRKWTPSPLFVRLNTSDLLVFRQVFMEEEYAITNLAQGQLEVIVDGGANIGLTSVYLALRHPEATILAIEPEADNLVLLMRNTSAFPNIKVVRAALWSRDQSLRFESLDAESWAFRVTEDAPGDTVNVPGISLLTLMEQNRVRRISLLKLDIEGAEIELLKDHSRWIDRVDYIVAELHDSIRPGCSQAFDEATMGRPVLGRTRELVMTGPAGVLKP